MFEAMQNYQNNPKPFYASSINKFENEEGPLGDTRQVPARDLKPGDVLSLFKNTVIKIDDMAPRLMKGKVRVTYKDAKGVVHNVDWNKGTKISVDRKEYVIGKTYTITMHNGEKFTGVCKYRRDMERYDRSSGTFGSSWEKVLSNDTHEVVVGPGPHYVPGEDPV